VILNVIAIPDDIVIAIIVAIVIAGLVEVFMDVGFHGFK
jgi:hypothetical protein